MHLRLSWRFTGYWLGFFCWLSITAGSMASAVYAEQGFRFVHLCSAANGVQLYDTGAEPEPENCHCLWSLAPDNVQFPFIVKSSSIASSGYYQSALLSTELTSHPRAPPSQV